jgi:uncharacterized cupredoxin-like copper-binding protein
MRSTILATGLLGLIAFTPVAFAADVVPAAGEPIVVTLLDKAHEGMDLSKNLGLGIGMGGDMSKASFAIQTDKWAVKAGMVTFKVTNASKDMEHEMLVVPIADMKTPLPYNDNENRLDEEANEDLGEVAELAPGASGELTVEMKPGLYALICNIPGHYAAGMWKVIAVQ